jgi:hypothetical protein
MVLCVFVEYLLAVDRSSCALSPWCLDANARCRYREDENTSLKCGHTFHIYCVESYMTAIHEHDINSLRCPTCKKDGYTCDREAHLAGHGQPLGDTVVIAELGPANQSSPKLAHPTRS